MWGSCIGYAHNARPKCGGVTDHPATLLSSTRRGHRPPPSKPYADGSSTTPPPLQAPPRRVIDHPCTPSNPIRTGHRSPRHPSKPHPDGSRTTPTPRKRPPRNGIRLSFATELPAPESSYNFPKRTSRYLRRRSPIPDGPRRTRLLGGPMRVVLSGKDRVLPSVLPAEAIEEVADV